MAKKAFWYQGKGLCPHCGKAIDLKVRRVVMEKAVPAEVDLRLTLEKDTQTTLE